MANKQQSQREPLLERALEIEALSEALDGARLGRGSLVLIEGSAGAGKSRLLCEAREQARDRDMVVLAARGSEVEREFPYGVARQLLGDRMPPNRERADPTLALIVELQAALVDLASQSAAPLLMAVDDLQWADRPSLRFLAYLALRVETLPIALAGTLRTGEADAPEDLLDALRSATGARALRPAPLSDDAVAALARLTFGADADEAFCRACAEASGGNPFFLRELLRALHEDEADARAERVRGVVPASVLHAVMRRVAALGRDATALASSAAILGDDAPLRVAAELAELEIAAAERAADGLARADVLAPGEPLRFAHPLIASALVADLGAFAAARAHRRAATQLLAQDTPAERVAAHLLLTNPEEDPSTLAPLRAAAAAAVERGEPASAARLLERALAEPPPAADRGEALLALAEAQALAGIPEAVTHLEQGLALSDDPRRRVEALAQLAGIMRQTGDFERAVEFARRARAALPADDPLQPKLVSGIIGAGKLHPPLLAELAAHLAPLIEATRAGHPPTEPGLLAHLALHFAVTDGSPALVRSLAEGAFADDPLVDADSHGVSFGYAIASLLFVDELALTDRIAGAALAEAQRRGAILATSTAWYAQAVAHQFCGRLDQAVVAGERALETYREGWAPIAWSAPTLALVHIERGDLDAAAQAVELAERGDPERIERAGVLEARAALRLARDDPASALADAIAAGDHVEQRFGPPSPRAFDWWRLAALAAHRLGDRAQAKLVLEPALTELRALDTPRQLGGALHVAGLVEGDGEPGLTLLEEAVGVLERSPARLFLAHALLDLGAARRRAGQRTAAREPLYRALELAEHFGAPPIAQRARGELHPLGARPRRASRSGSAALTASEWRVARLAAAGLTTSAIAQDLTVTPKTIKTHLAHIYRKLDIHSRTQLPDVLD